MLTTLLAAGGWEIDMFAVSEDDWRGMPANLVTPVPPAGLVFDVRA